jgi:GTP-binding protein
MDDHAPRGRRLTGFCRRMSADCHSGPAASGPPGTTFSPVVPPRAVDSTSAEAGRRLFAAEARFIAGAPSPSALPPEGLPEIAFVGRSNVGKSSLVNALTGRRTLARISNTPGRTRQINFFDLGGRLMLVDLPGYGYAEASKSAVKSWTSLVRYYLQTRAALRRVCLLIDSRHGLKEVDRPLMRMLDDAGVSYQIVLTKADKAGNGELASVVEQLMAELAPHVAAHPEIHLTSALDRRGIAELRETLANFAFPIGQSR